MDLEVRTRTGTLVGYLPVPSYLEEDVLFRERCVGAVVRFRLDLNLAPHGHRARGVIIPLPTSVSTLDLTIGQFAHSTEVVDVAYVVEDTPIEQLRRIRGFVGA